MLADLAAIERSFDNKAPLYPKLLLSYSFLSFEIVNSYSLFLRFHLFCVTFLSSDHVCSVEYRLWNIDVKLDKVCSLGLFMSERKMASILALA